MTKMDPALAKAARRDLGDLYGDNGFSMVYNDGIFANRLVRQYGMDLSKLAVASGYNKAKKAKSPDAIKRRSAKQERAAVVKYLNDLASAAPLVVLADLQRAALAIQKGEHVK